jgi:DNA-binding response OmpR family regulator
VTKRHRCAVLCIGSDPIHLNLRCSLLEEQDWLVLTAGSGYEGVIRFSQEPVDAVVIDLNGDGAESALITGELKRLRPKIPVIQVFEGKNLPEGATAQADAVVEKSEESRVLVETLRSLLRAS